MLVKCFTILANLLYKCLRMPLRILPMCCEWKENAKHGYLFWIIHIKGVSLCLISARPSPICLFSFKFGLIVHISPTFCGNVKTNASESLQTSYGHLHTSYDHYKCLAINKNGLQLLMNLLRIFLFLTNIRSMFLIFPRPRECLRTPQECLQTLWMLICNCKPIRKHICLGVRAALMQVRTFVVCSLVCLANRNKSCLLFSSAEMFKKPL